MQTKYLEKTYARTPALNIKFASVGVPVGLACIGVGMKSADCACPVEAAVEAGGGGFDGRCLFLDFF